jgi:hypothetical protein
VGRVTSTLAIPLILMLFPFLDVTLAILRRSVAIFNHNGGVQTDIKEIFAAVITADREHIHHKLLAKTKDHKKTVYILLSINAILGGISFIFYFSTPFIKLCITLALLIGISIVLLRLGYFPNFGHSKEQSVSPPDGNHSPSVEPTVEEQKDTKRK